MKRWLLTAFFLLALTGLALADSDTINPIDAVNPSSATFGGTSYPGQLYNSLSNEAAGRFQEQGFMNLVSTTGNANACLGATGASLTMTPTACVAYNAGFRSTETGSITFPDNSTCWVAMDNNTSGSNSGLTNFTRAGTTHYLFDCIDASQPTMAANSQLLMKVVTSGGAVTSVTDKRTFQAIPNGPISVSTGTFSGNVSVGGALSVTGNSTVGGSETVTGGQTVTGNSTVGGTLGVTGATTLGAAQASTLKVTTSVLQGAGLAHKRVVGCTTTGGLDSQCTNTITWTTPFPDVSYTAACMCDGMNFFAIVSVPPSGKTPSGLTVTTTAITSSNAQCNAVDCIAMHD